MGGNIGTAGVPTAVLLVVALAVVSPQPGRTAPRRTLTGSLGDWSELVRVTRVTEGAGAVWVTCVVPPVECASMSRLLTHDALTDAVPGAQLAEPADDVVFAVAEALLCRPLPPALGKLLRVADGVRAGELEVFGAERIAEINTPGEHSWQLPGWLLIGTAGEGRALVTRSDGSEVVEVASAPWDSRTMRTSADEPADLFLRHRGLALSSRAADWAIPGIEQALAQTRRSASHAVHTLASAGLCSRLADTDCQLPAGFQQITDPKLVWELLGSWEFEGFLLNYLPDPPVPGKTAEEAWSQACGRFGVWYGENLRARIDAAAVPAVVAAEHAGTVRWVANRALVAAAREDFAAYARGQRPDRTGPGHRLVSVLRAGHLPISLLSAC